MLTIRPATQADHLAISILLDTAFGQPNEAQLVARLRDDGDMGLELVADRAGRVIGHIAFPRMRAPRGWLALAPVCVRYEDTGKGIAKELITHGIDAARRGDYAAIVVLGNPVMYARFGFVFEGPAQLNGPYPKPYTGLYPIDPAVARARADLIYPPAFSAV